MLNLQPGHYRLLGYVLVIGISMLSLMPGKNLPQFSWDQILGIDKIFHFASYALASFFFIKSSDENAVFKIAWAMFLFGLLLECLQKILPGGRYFDVLDILANLAGILAATGLFRNSLKKISSE